LPKKNPPQSPLPTNAALSAHLWDLRSQAEAKLRCLTKLQQALDVYTACAVPKQRAVQRAKMLKDLQDLVTISHSLRSVSEQAAKVARSLS
jgi:hypothetical protein